MAHFLVPPNGSGVWYDATASSARIRGRMQVPLGSAHDITLGAGPGLFVRIKQPRASWNAFSESQNGDLSGFHAE